MAGAIKLKGFCPDADPSTPGIFTSCSGIVPTKSGFRAALTPSQQYVALPSACQGAFLAEYLDGTRRIFAGTQTHLYEGKNGTWTEIAGGQTFTGTSSAFWRFVMFGNDCIATNGVDAAQVVGRTGPFAALAGTPPIAPLIESVQGFVLMFSSNTWYSSGLGSDSIWTYNIANLSATSSLYDTPGPILAAKKLGANIVAYKNRGIYVGTFVGEPVVWSWNCVVPENGVGGQGCVVDLGNYHAILALDDFYLFDGTSLTPIQDPDGGPNQIKEWFFSNLDLNNVSLIQSRLDRVNDTVIWHFPSVNASPAGTLDTWVAWNWRTGKWTKGTDTIEMVVAPYLTAGLPMTYAQFEANYGTYSGVPNLPYESPLFAGSTKLVEAYFKTDHALYTLVGTPGAGTFTTGDYGDGVRYGFLRRVRPQFSVFPGTMPTLTPSHRRSLGDSLTTGSSVTMASDGWFNLRQNDRFHRLQFNFTGDFEMVGFDLDLADMGER